MLTSRRSSLAFSTWVHPSPSPATALVTDDEDPVDYEFLYELADEIFSTNNWELYEGDSSFPLPTKMLSRFVCNPQNPVKQARQLVHTNKDGAECQMWFSIWEEFEGVDQVDVAYPIHAKTGDPIHVLFVHNEQSINCPWVHGQPGLADRVLMPLILAASLDSCANPEHHAHKLHPPDSSDEDENEPAEIENDEQRGPIGRGYYELSKWLSVQRFDVYCKYKAKNVLLVDCYKQLAQLED